MERTMHGDQFDRLPMAHTCRRVDFDWVSIETVLDNRAVLVVVGMKHWLNMKIELIPACYQTLPEFWGIEVVGTLPGFGVSAFVDYNATLVLDGIRGSRGIEIIGATKTERRELARGSET
jgi:hypothetical protein